MGEEIINDAIYTLIRKVFPTIEKSIRKKNIDVFEEVEKGQ